MKIVPIIEYSMDQNAYLVYEGSEGIIIDPGAKAEKIIESAKAEGVEIKYILATHGHFDHVAHMADLKTATGAQIAVTQKTATAMNDPIINLSEGWLGSPLYIGDADVMLEEHKSTRLCGLDITVIPTPGHTADSVCFMINGVLFSGDTLFKQSIGRSDLPTGNGDTLINSIQKILFKLDDAIEVYPGHGHKTSIGYEKKYNLFL